MSNYNITAVYFSPTGTSKKGTLSIAQELSGSFQEIDLTIAAVEPTQTNFTAKDLLVFGAPVYSGRLYRGVVQRFEKLHGNNTPCIITVTYGNRHYDDALLELSDLVQKQGFIPIAAATLIGEHTYGKIQVGRPDTNDLNENILFAQKLKTKLTNKQIQALKVPGNHPYVGGKQGGSGGRFHPLTNDNCIKCGLCAKSCPEAAIDLSKFDDLDPAKCISCFRCIKKCPTQAKNMNIPEYLAFAENFSEKLSVKRNNEYFL